MNDRRKLMISPTGVSEYPYNYTNKITLPEKYATIFTKISEELKTNIQEYQKKNTENVDFSELNKLLDTILTTIDINRRLCADPVQKNVYVDTQKFDSDKINEFCDSMQFMLLKIQTVLNDKSNFKPKLKLILQILTDNGYDFSAKPMGRGGKKHKETKRRKRQTITKKNKKTKRRRRIQKK
jgi:hypothetical protein